MLERFMHIPSERAWLKSWLGVGITGVYAVLDVIRLAEAASHILGGSV
jgi:hypothetical protein